MRSIVVMLAGLLLVTTLGVRGSSAAPGPWQPFAGPGPWQPLERVMTRVPAPSTADFDSANGGTRSWRVRFHGDALEVAPLYSPRRALQGPFDPAIRTETMGSYGTQPAQAIHIEKAWFLSYFHGEFGGGLWVFSDDGTVGRRLLSTPVAGLQRYGNEILAETGSTIMLFVPPFRIHRFGLKDGQWQETGHADFPHDMSPVFQVGRHLYGIMYRRWEDRVLSELDLSGKTRPLTFVPAHASISDLAVAANGDFAIGSNGFAVRIHRRGNVFDSTWYAPRDCVQYHREPSDRYQTNIRCVGASGTPSYARHRIAPLTPYRFSSDGQWILALGGPQRLFRVVGLNRVDEIPLPNDSLGYFQRVEGAGEDVAVTGSSLWLRHAGRWSNVASSNPCGNQIALGGETIWCSDFQDADGSADIYGTTYAGAKVTASPTRGNPQLIVPGLSGDAWFSEKNASFIGHLTRAGTEELPVNSPVQSISRGRDVIWFTESDAKHYGFVGKNQIREFETGQYSRTEWIRGAMRGAWLREDLGGRILVRHVERDGQASGIYIPDARTHVVTNDGVLWAQSNDWPTVIRLTESGEMTRYMLPCADQRLTLRAGPQNGVWFLSLDPECSGFIDANGIHVRDLPSVETVYYR
jgi:hypothetical protein